MKCLRSYEVEIGQIDDHPLIIFFINSSWTSAFMNIHNLNSHELSNFIFITFSCYVQEKVKELHS